MNCRNRSTHFEALIDAGPKLVKMLVNLSAGTKAESVSVSRDVENRKRIKIGFPTNSFGTQTQLKAILCDFCPNDTTLNSLLEQIRKNNGYADEDVDDLNPRSPPMTYMVFDLPVSVQRDPKSFQAALASGDT